MTKPQPPFDCVIVGGGLAGGLCALALRARKPSARVLLIESGAAVGGNHTWSFHDSDLGDEEQALVAPLVTKRWPSVAVRFPDHVRTLPTGYASMTSAALSTAVVHTLAHPGSDLWLQCKVRAVRAAEVELEDGRRVRAPLVLDARGTPPVHHFETAGFQKFVGLEVELAHPLAPEIAARPLVMDASVAQQDGFRFVYVLPFSDRRVLIEDTVFSETPTLDRDAFRARVQTYARAQGWTIVSVLREEAGILPMPWAFSGTPPLGAPVRIGVLGGWFHPGTGYSLPWAARVAALIAGHAPRVPHAALITLWKELDQQAQFAQRLNRMLFRAVRAEDRWRVLSRFYRLPTGTIERFYGLRMTAWDRARILVGRPPRGVSFRAAFLGSPPLAVGEPA